MQLTLFFLYRKLYLVYVFFHRIKYIFQFFIADILVYFQNNDIYTINHSPYIGCIIETIFHFNILYFESLNFSSNIIFNNEYKNFKVNESFFVTNSDYFKKIINEIKIFKSLFKDNVEILDTLENRALKIYDSLSTREVVNKKKIRIGNKIDGGYIILDEISNINVTYSIGVSTTYSCEKNF